MDGWAGGGGCRGGLAGGEDRKQEEEFGTLGVAEARGWQTINMSLKDHDSKKA